MDPMLNAILGIAFVGLAFAGTILMYWLWGFPYDHNKFKSEAPISLRILHRIIGYLYIVIYLILMWQMVPRLWNYQIEFPARTVIHLTFGILIGIVLFLKFMVVRFFKHLESRFAPFFGTLLMISTVLLAGLSVPMAFKEYQLRKSVVGGDVFSDKNIIRIERLVSNAGFSDEVPLNKLSKKEFLLKGRAVLLNKCVQCHDLRTVLVKPRTPSDWVRTVKRMSERTVAEPIYLEEQWWVSAYLIALSPELHRGFKSKLEEDKSIVSSRQVTAITEFEMDKISLTEAASVYEMKCSACHFLSNVENNPPTSEEEVNYLVDRMILNGLTANEYDLNLILFYLSETFTK